MRLVNQLFQHRLVLRIQAKSIHAQQTAAAHEQPKADALAVDGGHRGNADIDFLAADAQADAAVLRQAFFRDVHARHDLDAGDDRGLETLQLRGHRRLVQHAVHAVPDAQVGLHRFHVDIRRPVLVGFPDDLIHEFDDGRLLVQLAEVLLGKVLLGGHFDPVVLDHLLQRVRADAVKFLGGLHQLRRGAERQPDAESGRQPQGVDQPGPEWIVRDHPQRAVFHRIGDDVVLENRLGREFFEDRLVQRHFADPDKRDVHRLRQRLEEHFLLGIALSGHHLGDGGVVLALPRKQFLDLFRREQAKATQQRTQFRCAGGRHFLPSLPLP